MYGAVTPPTGCSGQAGLRMTLRQPCQTCLESERRAANRMRGVRANCHDVFGVIDQAASPDLDLLFFPQACLMQQRCPAVHRGEMAIDRCQSVSLAQLEEFLVAHGQKLGFIDQMKPGDVEVLAIA